jgi:hypothetical protein
MKLTDAHIKAYGRGNGTLKTKMEDASKLAAKPEVRAQIEAYEREYMPIADYRAVREEMLSTMRLLAHEAPDARVRLAASKLLHDICQRHEEQARSLSTVNVDALITELAELAPQPTLEAVDESAGTDESAPADAAGEAERH